MEQRASRAAWASRYGVFNVAMTAGMIINLLSFREHEQEIVRFWNVVSVALPYTKKGLLRICRNPVIATWWAILGSNQ